MSSNNGRIRTEEVPGADVDRNVPYATQSSDADEDAKTKHGNQSNALTDRDLNGCEVFCRPKEYEDLGGQLLV
jgi:hypothetical protein